MDFCDWNDMHQDTRTLLQMPKDLFEASVNQSWPSPGNKLSLELVSPEDRAIRFFLDIRESDRSTSLSLGLAPDRKATMQTRKSDLPLIRVDYTDNPDVLHHRNPDGTKVVGTHVHIDIDGQPRLMWAFPLDKQSIVSPSDPFSVPSVFWAFQDACHITSQLNIKQTLGI